MTTVQQVVDRTLQRLTVGRRDTLNKLNGALTDSAATVTFEYDITGVGPGKRLSVGLEDMHVWSSATADKTATVQRGVGGSTAAAHSDGALVYVDATFSPFEIVTAVNEVLTLLPSYGLPRVQTVELTSDASRVGYDLTSVADVQRVRKVEYKEFGSEKRWVQVPRGLWRVSQKAETDDFAAGEGLFVYAETAPGRQIRVWYDSPYTAVSALADDVETVSGLPASAHSLLPIGAAYRLALGRSIARSSMNAQGDTRRPDEVSTTDTRQALVPLQFEWQQALAAAKDDLTRKYGL